MKVDILGPLTITDDLGQVLHVRLEPKQEIALIALAANADRGVSLRELVRAVYATTDAALYKSSVESIMSRLRSSLGTASADARAALPPAKAGFYQLTTPTEHVDALRFLQRAEHLLNQ